METPKPVNLNALSALLNKSKKVMQISEELKPIVNKYVDTESVKYNQSNEDDYEDRVPDSAYNYNLPPTDTSGSLEVSDYTTEQVMNSKLPQAIKESMLKNRIPRAHGSTSNVDMDAISKLSSRLMNVDKSPQPKKTINEELVRNRVGDSNMITVSKEELSEMINEGIMKFFKQEYDKTLTEQAIKKTINLLIKEGKITTKKK